MRKDNVSLLCKTVSNFIGLKSRDFYSHLSTFINLFQTFYPCHGIMSSSVESITSLPICDRARLLTKNLNYRVWKHSLPAKVLQITASQEMFVIH